jgi:hypothetical protein
MDGRIIGRTTGAGRTLEITVVDRTTEMAGVGRITEAAHRCVTTGIIGRGLGRISRITILGAGEITGSMIATCRRLRDMAMERGMELAVRKTM